MVVVEIVGAAIVVVGVAIIVATIGVVVVVAVSGGAGVILATHPRRGQGGEKRRHRRG